MTRRYYRPLVQSGYSRPEDALGLVGGPLWFTHLEERTRAGVSRIVPASSLTRAQLDPFTSPRKPLGTLPLDQPAIMGVLNVTPDSFSDGGQHNAPDQAVARAQEMLAEGAQIIDVGGESTRPGADFVDAEAEKARTVPIIRALRGAGVGTLISIDTRKADVAQAALAAGADMFNDVSAFTYDADSLPLAVRENSLVCLMHAQGAPKTMQDAPEYNDVALDIYDYLAGRVQICQDAGLSRDRILIDPGIGFGKTTEHNLDLVRNLSMFHGLGCPILLGVSRKRFIGVIGDAQEPAQRMPGSVAVALEALRQGVQVIRVHDVWQTRQAFDLWRAVR